VDFIQNARELLIKQQKSWSTPPEEYLWLEAVKSGVWAFETIFLQLTVFLF